MALNVTQMREVAANQEQTWRLWFSGMIVCALPMVLARSVEPGWMVWAGSLCLMSAVCFFAGSISRCNWELTETLMTERRRLQMLLGSPVVSQTPRANAALGLCSGLFYTLATAYLALGVSVCVYTAVPNINWSWLALLGMGLCAIGYLLQHQRLSQWTPSVIQGLAIGAFAVLVLRVSARSSGTALALLFGAIAVMAILAARSWMRGPAIMQRAELEVQRAELRKRQLASRAWHRPQASNSAVAASKPAAKTPTPARAPQVTAAEVEMRTPAERTPAPSAEPAPVQPVAAPTPAPQPSVAASPAQPAAEDDAPGSEQLEPFPLLDGDPTPLSPGVVPLERRPIAESPPTSEGSGARRIPKEMAPNQESVHLTYPVDAYPIDAVVPSNSEPPAHSHVVINDYAKAAGVNPAAPPPSATFDPLGELTDGLKDGWHAPSDLVEKAKPPRDLPDFATLQKRLRKQSK